MTESAAARPGGTSLPGVVIAACWAADADAVEARFRAHHLRGIRRNALSESRVRLHATTVGEDSPAPAVRALRAEGIRAVEGPPTPGQAIGWRRRNAPVWFSHDAFVCPPWSDADRSSSTAVEIDPGAGFGAGRHPSTLALLEMIARRPAAPTLLDVGCGSGVLSVAAAMHGTTDVIAIDIDSRAIEATRANAIYNGVDDRVVASTTALTAVGGAFAAIVANIHAHVLVTMAPDFGRLLAPGGWLALSGISRAQVSTLAARLTPLAVVEQVQRDDWVALVLT